METIEYKMDIFEYVTSSNYYNVYNLIIALVNI